MPLTPDTSDTTSHHSDFNVKKNAKSTYHCRTHRWYHGAITDNPLNTAVKDLKNNDIQYEEEDAVRNLRAPYIHRISHKGLMTPSPSRTCPHPVIFYPEEENNTARLLLTSQSDTSHMIIPRNNTTYQTKNTIRLTSSSLKNIDKEQQLALKSPRTFILEFIQNQKTPLPTCIQTILRRNIRYNNSSPTTRETRKPLPPKVINQTVIYDTGPEEYNGNIIPTILTCIHISSKYVRFSYDTQIVMIIH